MSRTVYYVASSMDGFIADASDSLDWLMRQDQDPSGPLNYESFIETVGAVVMGSTTYEWILDHSGEVAAETGSAWPYEMPAWVMTSRELAVPNDSADVRFARGSVRDVHARMAEAAAGRDLWVIGGGDLAGQLVDVGLLDEVIVYVAPVTLGSGRPLLPRAVDLTLLETHRNRAFVASRYEVVRS